MAISEPELKRCNVFVLDSGTLTIVANGPAQGWGSLSIKTDQLLTEGDRTAWELPPSELRELRDFLDKIFPRDKEAAR